MSMRQLHEFDPVDTTVTDQDGRRQGILVARSGEWCWVHWAGLDSPTTEHVGDLWICQNRPSLLEQVTACARDLCRSPLALGA